MDELTKSIQEKVSWCFLQMIWFN